MLPLTSALSSSCHRLYLYTDAGSYGRMVYRTGKGISENITQLELQISWWYVLHVVDVMRIVAKSLALLV